MSSASFVGSLRSITDAPAAWAAWAAATSLRKWGRNGSWSPSTRSGRTIEQLQFHLRTHSIGHIKRSGTVHIAQSAKSLRPAEVTSTRSAMSALKYEPGCDGRNASSWLYLPGTSATRWVYGLRIPASRS